jgi:glycosyltransferase involved in cell wall biosynthesis
MKILYLITKSNWGGAQRYVYDLATSFSAKGMDCVVAYGGNGELETKLVEAGIRTVSIKSLARDISISKEIAVIKETYELVRREQPDVLHLNSSKAAGIGALIGRFCRVPHIIVTMHGAPFREDRRFFVKKLIYFFTWLTCLFAHRIITVSKQDEADIGRMFFVRKKVVTIYNGIPVDGAIPNRERAREREVHVVSIGDLTRNKGYLYGLEAIDALVKKGIPIKYTIEGEGEDRKKIEEYIAIKKLENNVKLLGRTLTTKDLLHEYDIFILASVKEGLPYVLLEAGKARIPVVATITGGVPEIVRHEETGLLVQPKDVKGLASALERLITDRKYGKELGQKLHSHIAQNFSYSKMLVETARTYGLMEKKSIEDGVAEIKEERRKGGVISA